MAALIASAFKTMCRRGLPGGLFAVGLPHGLGLGDRDLQPDDLLYAPGRVSNALVWILAQLMPSVLAAGTSCSRVLLWAYATQRFAPATFLSRSRRGDQQELQQAERPTDQHCENDPPPPHLSIGVGRCSVCTNFLSHPPTLSLPPIGG